MKPSYAICVSAALALLAAALPGPLSAQSREWETVESAVQVLQEISAIATSGVPRAMMADAEGIAVFPNVVKLGFIVGGRRGRGVLAVRAPDGTWTNPVFMILTGGSLGYQIGIQATDVILVFKSRKSIDGIMRGKFTLGADASVAAGPLGLHAEAATDAQLKAEIYSYSRSRGLFAGVALEGSMLEIDSRANDAFYGKLGVAPVEIVNGTGIQTPDAAMHLRQQLAAQAPAGNRGVGMPVLGAQAVPATPPMDAETTRRQLADSAQRLYARLDEPWREYLALPTEVFSGRVSPSPEAAGTTLRRFDTVKAEPAYRIVADTPEFQATYLLLQRYVEIAGRVPALPAPGPALPAPPPGAVAPR